MTTRQPWGRSARLVRAPGALALLVAFVLSTAGLALASPASAGGVEPAWVRAAHLVPGLDVVEMTLAPFVEEGAEVTAESEALSTVAVYGFVGDYQQVPAGTYAASVRSPDADPGEPPLLTLSVELVAGEAITIAALGEPDSPRLSALADDIATPTDGTAQARVLSASAAADTVSVSVSDGPVVSGGATAGDPSGYVSVPTGEQTLRVAPVGEGPVATAESVVVFEPGSVYTVLVLDAREGALRLDPVTITDAVGMAAQTPVGAAPAGFGGLAELSTPLSALTLAVATGAVAFVVGTSWVGGRRALARSRHRRPIAARMTPDLE